jgi:5-methylthioadenosine/S-adenosylhomocysteine deaminase
MGVEPTVDLLLTGGTVVTVDDGRRVLDPGAVAVAGDRITYVGDPAGAPPATRTVDCSGMAVIPGFVDCHNHLFQTLARGLGEGLSLWPWLCDFMWPFAASITPAEAVSGATIAAVEAVRSGTTTVLDNHYSPVDLDTTGSIADAIERVGLRGVVARGMFGEYTPVAREHGLAESLFRYSAGDEIAITREAAAARPEGSRVAVWPAPINVIYNDQDLVRDGIALARELGTGWHTHCSEAEADPDIYLEAYGIRPIDWLYEEGLLGGGATIAHGIWFDDREVERVGETATGISHCPTSNETLASGVIRLADLRRAGAVVAIGTDGGAAGHRQDMFEEMKCAMMLQRVSELDPTSTPAEVALEMATRDGARYLGIDAGILEEGRLADVAVINLKKPHLRPLHRVVSTLAYAARGSDVAMTIVGGDVVYEDGRATRVDEAEVMAEAQARADELVERAGLSGLRTPWAVRGLPANEPAAS